MTMMQRLACRAVNQLTAIAEEADAAARRWDEQAARVRPAYRESYYESRDRAVDERDAAYARVERINARWDW